MSDRFPPLSPPKSYPKRRVATAAATPRHDFRLNVPALELCLLTALTLVLALS